MIRLLLLMTLLSGCAARDINWKLEILHAQLAVLNERVEALETREPSPGGGPTAVTEAEAKQLLAQATAAYEAFDYDTARTLFQRIIDEYQGTRSVRAAQRPLVELQVIGKDVEEFATEEWLQGSASPDDYRMMVLVFFEQWCPHCKREVPRLESNVNDWASRDIGVVGFTRLSRSSTKENTMELLRDHQVTYPVAVETGAIAEYYSVSGIPAAAIIGGGKVLWRGHPARIEEPLLEGLSAKLDAAAE
jgi:thiol-disulfide isomerase/thioredoxin